MKKRLKVLLVDDDEINNFLNRAILEETEIVEKVDVVTDGKQSLEYLLNACGESNRPCPDLVIFDHHLPVMDGLEMVRELNALDFINKHDTVFLLLGINTLQKDIQLYTEQGICEIATKPLSERTVKIIYTKYWQAA